MSFDKAKHGNMILDLIPGPGQIVVACSATVYWYLFSGTHVGWFLAGALLWVVAVFLKMLCASIINQPVLRFLHSLLPRPLLMVAGGAFTGFQSSFFEIGITILGVLIWPSLGRNAGIAIAIGVGAGAIEALLLGIYALVAVFANLSKGSEAQKPNEQIEAQAGTTPLSWLIAPVERTIAILCHASTRALILLGVVHGSYAMVFWGFLLFAMLDGVAGAAHISGKLDTISVWWIELAMSPFALASVPVLIWCYENYG